jgi:hypothetical protein
MIRRCELSTPSLACQPMSGGGFLLSQLQQPSRKMVSEYCIVSSYQDKEGRSAMPSFSKLVTCVLSPFDLYVIDCLLSFSPQTDESCEFSIDGKS